MYIYFCKCNFPLKGGARLKGLKIVRKEKGFSQLQLAEFLHISPSIVAQWELGEKEASAGQVIFLCRILGCTPAELFLPPECNYTENSAFVPVFSGNGYTQVSFSLLPANPLTSVCQFGIVVNQDISGRICRGDICYFQLDGSCCKNDTVITLDNSNTPKLFVADENDVKRNNISAVCRYMQSRL